MRGTVKVYFLVQCVTFVYVCLTQSACIAIINIIVIKQVENSYLPLGLVQAKNDKFPGIPQTFRSIPEYYIRTQI